MASSGLVAKKIALFEPKLSSAAEHSCRLKRKHAIRRKKYLRERKLSSPPTSLRSSLFSRRLAASSSEERLNENSDSELFYASSDVANSFSASCSALLDLIYNPPPVSVHEQQKQSITETSSRVPKEDRFLSRTHLNNNVNVKPSNKMFSLRDKKILCRSSSLEEAFPARLNIIDIDIEIRVEKEPSSGSTSPDSTSGDNSTLSDNTFCPSSSRGRSKNCIETIKLKAKMDPSTNNRINDRLIGRKNPISVYGLGSSSCSSTSTCEHYQSSSCESSGSSSQSYGNSNYYCSSCGNSNYNAMDNLQEHIYENFALEPPPRPPKRQPAVTSLLSSSLCDIFANCSFVTSQNITTGKMDSRVVKDSSSSGTLGNSISDNDFENNVKNKITEVENQNAEEIEKEPFYEDLYDYCLPPDDLYDTDFIPPVAVTSFVNDKDDEVEYCDCSTVMAMAINSLNSGGTVIYNTGGTANTITDTIEEQFRRTTEDYELVSRNGFSGDTYTKTKCQQIGKSNEGQGEDETIKSLTNQNQTTHVVANKKQFYLGCLIDQLDENGNEGTGFNPLLQQQLPQSEALDFTKPLPLSQSQQQYQKEKEDVEESLSNNRSSNDSPTTTETNGNSSPPKLQIQSPPLNNEMLTIDSKSKQHRDKIDEDDLKKPLLPLPNNNPKYSSQSCSSSNSSGSDSFYSEPIYGITNQITNFTSSTRNPGPPVPDTRRPSMPLSTPLQQNVISCNNVIRTEPLINKQYGMLLPKPPFSCNDGGGGQVIYADSIPRQGATSNGGLFQPNDKLPPIPPSKFSSIAKSAGRRIAKKFMAIRKNSKSSLENYEPSCSPSSAHGPSGAASIPMTISGASTPNGSTGETENVQTEIPKYSVAIKPKPITPLNVNNVGQGKTTVSQAPLRKPVSRPSIPPPEPPKSAYGGSSNGSAANYSIYDKSDKTPRENDQDDDDFDDSDFYDSDSELIRNFVSQVQPIYSMEEEPLYQYYAYGISIKPDDDYQPVIPKNLGLTLDMLVPRVGQRTLWCELSEVIASGILSILSDKQKQLQEAIFEILTSEVSYLKSLDVLLTVFHKNEELIGVLSGDERRFLFGNIEEVRECAHAFLAELLAKWDESWYIQEIGEILNINTNSRFSVYKEYCRNKPHQDKVMQRLRESRDEFVNVIKILEEDSRCQMLRIDSFLMLPMQRITRLPLLVNAVIQRTTSVKEKAHCEEALKSLTDLVLSCNEAARESQDAEETTSIMDKLEFTRIPRPISLLGQFIMKGDFMKNPFDQNRGNQLNWTFKKSKRTLYWLLLFSNQLLVTKKKPNGKFEVVDLSSPDEANIKPLPNLEGVTNDFPNFFMLHFDKKETVYFLAARTNSEIERWKSKLDSIQTSKKLRVESIFPYDARRADELSFHVGDVIEVAQMQPDGWYYGTKVNGGQSGWFPGNYCYEL